MMITTINSRIKQIIEIKCGGSQREFAKLIDASPQYVAKIIKDGSVGMEPVVKILNLFEDVDARWLITGKGEMIDPRVINEVKYFLHQNIKEMLKVEQYLPFMSPEELKQYKDAVSNFTAYNYSDQQLERWSKLSESHGK